MARYRGELRGARGEASRLGTPSSGLTVKASGWNVGGQISARAIQAGSGKVTTRDELSFELTSGSNGRGVTKHIITVRELPEGRLEFDLPLEIEVQGGVVTAVRLAGVEVSAAIIDHDAEAVGD